MAETLTLVTGGALPAVFADAGESVSSTHTGPSIGARTGGTGAVLCWGKKKKKKSTNGRERVWKSHRVHDLFDNLLLEPHPCCRCSLPSLEDTRSGKRHRGRNRCLRYCRWWRHTGSHLVITDKRSQLHSQTELLPNRTQTKKNESCMLAAMLTAGLKLKLVYDSEHVSTCWTKTICYLMLFHKVLN